MRLWSILASPVRKDRRARDKAMDCAALPNERDARSAFSIEIQRLLAEDDEIKKRIEETLSPSRLVPSIQGPRKLASVAWER